MIYWVSLYSILATEDTSLFVCNVVCNSRFYVFGLAMLPLTASMVFVLVVLKKQNN